MEGILLGQLHENKANTQQLPRKTGESNRLLRFLRNRKSTNWQRSVHATAGGRRPVVEGVSPTLDPSFPWATLQQHTDLYLSKKKKENAEQIEARLIGFIKASGDRIDIAIAACGHKLRSQTLRDLLGGPLNFGVSQDVSLETYLQAIVAANRVNTFSVNGIEARRAISLIATLAIGTTSPGHCLHALIQILIEGVPIEYLIYPHINLLAKQACLNFASQLQNLKAGGHLRRAYHASKWVAKINETFNISPENLGPEILLETFFPAWGSWAAWKPDEERLKRWEDGFSAEERDILVNLLAFEGPDIGGRRTTLKEGTLSCNLDLCGLSPVRMGMVDFEAQLVKDARSTIERLLRILDATCGASSSEIALLIHLLVGKTITLSSFLILENVRARGDSTIVSLLLQVYGTKGEPRSAQLAAAMHLIPLLSDSKTSELREQLSPELVSLVSGGMEDMQKNLQSSIIAGADIDDLDIKIQSFGQALLETWAFPLLTEELQNQLKSWPSKDDIHTLHCLRIGVENEREIRKKVDDYCVSLLIKGRSVDSATIDLIKSLMSVWRSVKAEHNGDLCFVALNVAKQAEFGPRSQCQCLDELPTLDPSFWTAMRKVIVKGEREADAACIDMAKLLASMPKSSLAEYWRLILYNNVYQREGKLIDYTFKTLKPRGWIQFVTDLSIACANLDIKTPSQPVFMNPNLHAWVRRLTHTKYVSMLTNLEKDLPKSAAATVIRRFLLGGHQQEYYIDILQALAKSYAGPPKRAMLTVLAQLRPNGSNLQSIANVMGHLAVSSKQGLDACLRLINLQSGKATQIVAQAFLASWLQPSNMNAVDQGMLMSLARLLDMSTGPSNEPSMESLNAAADYLDAQFAEIFIEAQRLEGMRLAYRKTDPKGISELLSKIGIQEPSDVDDFLASLPPSLVGLVDMVEKDVLEMHFPLKLTAIEQIGLGVGNARSLMLRLNMNHLNKPSFCMHLDNEKKTTASSKGHKPWNPVRTRSLPDNPPCHGRANRLTYQVTRILSRHLQKNKPSSLEEIHRLITTALRNLNKTCLVCGTSKQTQLRRSATCQRECNTLYQLAPLEVRLAEICHDPAVMDLLLTMVHHAAASRKICMLPNCAFTDTLHVAQALANVPAISTLTGADNLGLAIRRLGGQAEKLLSWTCLNYRGFLVSATGKMHIPGMPVNTRQFLMASAAPELETAFAAKVGTVPTRVLWHGTSMERLYAIMCEGLKICSGTALQLNGAASGPGIYTAEELATSWNYSVYPQANWTGSSFHNLRVLLGLEAAGPPVGTGIQLVKDPSTLMVRYVFLVPTNAVIPAAANVAPAMLSAYKSLRAGVL